MLYYDYPHLHMYMYMYIHNICIYIYIYIYTYIWIHPRRWASRVRKCCAADDARAGASKRSLGTIV